MQGILDHMILEPSPVSNLIQADKRVEGALERRGMLGSQVPHIITACPEERKGRGLSHLSRSTENRENDGDSGNIAI